MAEIEIYAKPVNLYRYRSLGSKLQQEVDALLGGYIYCPLLSDMNDPMEGEHRLSRLFSGASSGPRRHQSVAKILSSTGIASMSEVFDHEPMWAHYAEKFSGMCVQYNLNALLRGMAADVGITRMTYSEQEPVLLKDQRSDVDRARHCLSSKTVRWASEREWRVFQPEKGPASYGKERAVRKIFLGSRIEDADARRLEQAGRQLQVPVVRMSIEAYAMKFDKVFTPKPRIKAKSRAGKA